MAAIKQNTLNLQSLLDTANALPEAGVTVQKKSGTFTTGSNGTVTVNCGFCPDLLLIHKNEADAAYYSAAFAFEADSRKGQHNTALYATDYTTFYMYDIFAQTTTSGFSATVQKMDYSFEFSAASKVTFNYVAVKYT